MYIIHLNGANSRIAVSPSNEYIPSSFAQVVWMQLKSPFFFLKKKKKNIIRSKGIYVLWNKTFTIDNCEEENFFFNS